MKSILGATVLLGGSSVVSVLVGLASAKAWAVMLGPSGLGLLALIQSFLGLAVLVAGMGIGAGLVRAGAHALARQDLAWVAAQRRAAWLLFWVLGGLAALTLSMFRGSFSEWLLGGSEHADTIPLVALALLFTLAAGIQTNVLNAYHRVGALAKVGIFSSVLGAAMSLPLLWLWGLQGIGPALIALAATSWAVSHYFLRDDVGQSAVAPAGREVLKAARSLLRFGVPYTASMLVGAGVQLALPFLVLRILGAESVGYYKAAVTISLGYLAFLLTAMAQDYYPRVSAASDQPTGLAHLINLQHRLVMLLTTPLILALLALAPYIVPLVYTAEFYPTVEVLEWQLIGDLLKVSSWTMSFVILARCGSSTFFFTELLGGLITVLANWLGMRWFGLAGLGVAFLVTYLAYYLLVWTIVRREVGLIWTNQNKLLLCASVSLGLATRLPGALGLQQLHTPLALSLALLAAVGSFSILRRELAALRLPTTPQVRTELVQLESVGAS